MSGTDNNLSQVTSHKTGTVTDNDVIQLPSSAASQTWACSDCRTSFDDEIAQREDVKSPWHVYNLKRHVDLLPPTTLEVFNTQVRRSSEYVENSPAEGLNRPTEHDVVGPHQCLFCHWTFDDDGQGLADNVKHMSVAHGFFIPNITLVSDLGTFLEYLATAVHEWHECLYCGTVRDCTAAIQSHMRDKAHCKLNLDREPELLGFWEEKGDEEFNHAPIKASIDVLVLSSGRPATLRGSPPRQTKAARLRSTSLALRTDSWPRNQEYRQLSRRDEMGIQNVGPQQRQELVLAVKRSQKEESVASRANEWSHARRANKQKHDQAHGPLSWAKGGMHNLLPR